MNSAIQLAGLFHRIAWSGLVFLLFALLAANPLAASGAKVYRTVDENGVVAFSDTPPEGEQNVETLEVAIPTTHPDSLQQDRLEQMRETTDRMAADRMAREKHRAELRKLDRAERQPETVIYQPDYEVDLPIYYPRRYGYQRPRPDHPVVRPPLRPQPRAQRDTYPSKLIRQGYNPRVREAFVN